jgi:hypothetical protein
MVRYIEAVGARGVYIGYIRGYNKLLEGTRVL